jgi:hypothetical protein
LSRAQLDMRLAQGTCELVDLLGHPRLRPGRLAGTVALLKTLAAPR